MYCPYENGSGPADLCGNFSSPDDNRSLVWYSCFMEIKCREDHNPIIFDTADGQQLRINMIGSWLRRRFRRKVVKLSLDGGFTCPNRDGSKGRGGCLFCSDSGSGDMASRLEGQVCGRHSRVAAALQEQALLLSGKWPEAGYIAYFQSHTNTYAPVEVLKETFDTVLEYSAAAEEDAPQLLGLAIATRSDCISEEALDLLTELNRRTFLWVELGLQTIHDSTARDMNLCHTLADYDDTVRRLTARGIRVVTHLILGLPGETKEMILDSVRYVCRPLETAGAKNGPAAHLFGLKLHMLNVVRGSGMERAYPDYVPFDSIDEYTDLLIEAIELVPPDITIHRISGDAPRSTLIAPAWSYRKRTILNEIHRKMRERDTWQGKKL